MSLDTAEPAQPVRQRKSVEEILADAKALRKSTSKVTASLRRSVSEAQAGIERVENRREYVESLKEADRLRDERVQVLTGKISVQKSDLEERWEAVQNRLFQAGERLFGPGGEDASSADAVKFEFDNADHSARIVLDDEDIVRWLQSWPGRVISATSSKAEPLPKAQSWRSVSDIDWKRSLSVQEYGILRQKDTEAPNSTAFFVASNTTRDKLSCVASNTTRDKLSCEREDHNSLFEFPKALKASSAKGQSCRSYYCCRGCQLPLYPEESHFESGCGWPAFGACFFSSAPSSRVGTEPELSSHVAVETDADGVRFEILCNRCRSHLGHVFCNERFPGSERHCVNSRCLEIRVAGAQRDRALAETTKPSAKSSPKRRSLVTAGKHVAEAATRASRPANCPKRALVSGPVFGKLRDFKKQFLEDSALM